MSFIIFLKQYILKQLFFSGTNEQANRAFLFGDAVKVSFFVYDSQLIMAEECYFYLMASMRKMRMNIPLSYTLEFFEELFKPVIAEKNISDAIITFMAYRNTSERLAKAEVSYCWYFQDKNILETGRPYELDILKEININTNLLSSIRVHCPENVYAAIYASENDLDDVILLNPNKRIARTAQGNILFLEGNSIKVPKQSEGALISPLMENFITFVHKNGLAEIAESEMNAFESQKADEILLISDEHGIFPVRKIRNKEFGSARFMDMLAAWGATFI